MTLTQEQVSKVDEHLSRGHRLEAVRLLRKYSGWDLKQAVEFADVRERELGARSPEGMKALDGALVATTANDPLLDEIGLVAGPEVKSFGKLLRELERLLFGLNYQVTLDAKLVQLPDSALPLCEVMLKCYPKSHPELSKFARLTIDEMKSEVEFCLMYEGDESSGVDLKGAKGEMLQGQLLPRFWTVVDQLAGDVETQIYGYSDDQGLPGYYVWWFFAFLIHSSKTRRCLLIVGSASD